MSKINEDRDQLEGKTNKMTREEDSGKLSSVDEINNRRTVKARGAKSEETNDKKGNFIFNAQESSGGLFKKEKTFEKDSNSNQNTSKESNSPKGMFKNLPNPFSKESTGGFKNIFDNKPAGSLFGNSENKPAGSLFGNLENKPAGSIFGNSLFNAENKPATGSLFGNTGNSNLFSNAGSSFGIFGNSNNSFLTENKTKTFLNSDSEDGEYDDPEKEIEIKSNEKAKKAEVNVEINEKVLKLSVPEFFIYDFNLKKYNSIGKGDFTIEYDRTDVKKKTPLLIFRNSVLKILFQGIFKGNLTKLETVNKNFKTISVIQKLLVINENTKKPEFKAIKMNHNNDQESKNLLENFKILEENYSKLEENEEKININAFDKNENHQEEQRQSNLKRENNTKKNVQFESNVEKQSDVRKVNITRGKIVNINLQVISPSKN